MTCMSGVVSSMYWTWLCLMARSFLNGNHDQSAHGFLSHACIFCSAHLNPVSGAITALYHVVFVVDWFTTISMSEPLSLD
jgi:hypothetical protein